VGVPIQKENKASLGPDAKGGKWGGNITSSSDSGAWGSVVSSLSGVRGGAPAENDFIVI